MRATLLLLFTACSSIAQDASPDAATVELACRASLQTYCGQQSCDLTLDAALHDNNLCPAYLRSCGAYQAVTTAGVDTSTDSYYLNGELVAVVSHVDVLPRTCSAGPASFAAPDCVDNAPLISACSK